MAARHVVTKTSFPAAAEDDDGLHKVTKTESSKKKKPRHRWRKMFPETHFNKAKIKLRRRASLVTAFFHVGG